MTNTIESLLMGPGTARPRWIASTLAFALLTGCGGGESCGGSGGCDGAEDSLGQTLFVAHEGTLTAYDIETKEPRAGAVTAQPRNCTKTAENQR